MLKTRRNIYTNSLQFIPRSFPWNDTRYMGMYTVMIKPEYSFYDKNDSDKGFTDSSTTVSYSILATSSKEDERMIILKQQVLGKK